MSDAMQGIWSIVSHDKGSNTMDVHPKDKFPIGMRAAQMLAAVLHNRTHSPWQSPKGVASQILWLHPTVEGFLYCIEVKVQLQPGDELMPLPNGTQGCTECCDRRPETAMMYEAPFTVSSSVGLDYGWQRVHAFHVVPSNSTIQVQVNASKPPQFTRYHYDDHPQCGIYSKGNLPLYPFQLAITS